MLAIRPIPASAPAPRIPARVWALIVPAGLVVVALLVGILLVLSSVRNQIVEQNQRTRLLIQKADPTLQRAPAVLDATRPLVKQALPVLKASRAAIPQARRTARESRALLASAQPVVNDLGPVVASLPPLLQDLGPAAADLRPAAADLRPVAADLRPVAAELRAADLGGVLASVQRLATAGDRALPALADLATEVRDRELLRRLSRALPRIGRIAELQRAAVQVNRQQLTHTANIERLFVDSLAVQKRVLGHVEAIDRKLPGPTAP